MESNIHVSIMNRLGMTVIGIIGMMMAASGFPEEVFALSGGGTAGDPYLITSLSDFYEFAGNETFWDKYTRLDCNIDLGSRVYTRAVIAPSKPASGIFVGTSFQGTLDGNGHTIKNLVIDSTNAESSEYLGLVGRMDANATIMNLSINKIIIRAATSGNCIGGLAGEIHTGTVTNCHASGTLSTGDYSYKVGGLVGRNWHGTLSGCHTEGTLSCGNHGSGMGGLVGSTGGSIVNCYSTANQWGGLDTMGVGGLVGSHGGVMENCYATGYVKDNLKGWDFGGLVGSNGGTINNCYATGMVKADISCGGLVGYNVGVIGNSYATGDIVAPNDALYLGGLVGNASEGEVYSCYSTGSVTGGDFSQYVGGFVGNNDGTIQNCYTIGTLTVGRQSDYIGGLVGWFQGPMMISECYAAGRIVTGSFCYGVGGLIGTRWNSQDIVENCFWDIEVTGLTKSEGGTGLSTAQMRDAAIYRNAHWDFINETKNGTEDFWKICDVMNYPKLDWQTIPGDIVCPDGVSLTDFEMLMKSWGSRLGQPEFQVQCDWVQDGIIDINDLIKFSEKWLEGV